LTLGSTTSGVHHLLWWSKPLQAVRSQGSCRPHQRRSRTSNLSLVGRPTSLHNQAFSQRLWVGRWLVCSAQYSWWCWLFTGCVKQTRGVTPSTNPSAHQMFIPISKLRRGSFLHETLNWWILFKPRLGDTLRQLKPKMHLYRIRSETNQEFDNAKLDLNPLIKSQSRETSDMNWFWMLGFTVPPKRYSFATDEVCFDLSCESKSLRFWRSIKVANTCKGHREEFCFTLDYFWDTQLYVWWEGTTVDHGKHRKQFSSKQTLLMNDLLPTFLHNYNACWQITQT